MQNSVKHLLWEKGYKVDFDTALATSSLLAFANLRAPNGTGSSLGRGGRAGPGGRDPARSRWPPPGGGRCRRAPGPTTAPPTVRSTCPRDPLTRWGPSNLAMPGTLQLLPCKPRPRADVRIVTLGSWLTGLAGQTCQGPFADPTAPSTAPAYTHPHRGVSHRK